MLWHYPTSAVSRVLKLIRRIIHFGSCCWKCFLVRHTGIFRGFFFVTSLWKYFVRIIPWPNLLVCLCTLKFLKCVSISPLWCVVIFSDFSTQFDADEVVVLCWFHDIDGGLEVKYFLLHFLNLELHCGFSPLVSKGSIWCEVPLFQKATSLVLGGVCWKSIIP